jgi:hypothetical protein
LPVAGIHARIPRSSDGHRVEHAVRAAPGSLVIVLAFAAALGSCGPERTFTGVWRLESCGGEGHAVCGDDPFTYELHLGRFGDDVAGLLVKYVVPGPDLDAFDAQNDCGCVFLQSGAAGDTSLAFQVQTTEPGCADPQVPLAQAQACGQPPVALCSDTVRFDLDGDDQELTGTIKCGTGTDAKTFQVRFRREPGRPRTRCYTCPAP